MSEFKGIIRQVDRLGRIVIPKEIRKQLDLKDGEDCLQMTFSENGDLVLRKHTVYCVFCGAENGLSSFKGKPVCNQCRNSLKSTDEI